MMVLEKKEKRRKKLRGGRVVYMHLGKAVWGGRI